MYFKIFLILANISLWIYITPVIKEVIKDYKNK